MGNVNDGASGDPGNGSERGPVQTSPEVKKHADEERRMQEISCGKNEQPSEGSECGNGANSGREFDAGQDKDKVQESREGSDCREREAERRDNLSERVEHLVATTMDDDISEEEMRLLQRAEEWSGLLPDPESFSKYPRFAQDKMVAWNDAQILDESKRSDRLMNAAVSHAKTSLVLSGAIQILSLLATFVAFIMTESALSFGFLTVPVATIVINVAIKVRGKRRKKKRKRRGKSKHRRK